MKISEIKKKFLGQIQSLLRDQDQQLMVRYTNNIKHAFNGAFGKAKGDDEFVPRYREDVMKRFEDKLRQEITLKSGGKVGRIPVELIPTVCIALATCLPTYLNEEKSVFSSLFNTLSGTAKRLSSGETYGPNKAWSLPVPCQKNTKKVFFEPVLSDPLAEFKSAIDSEVITDEDSQNTAFLHIQQGFRPLVMNAANAYHIGGAFENNRGTQEESLFFTTNLHQHLYDWGFEKNGRYHYRKPLQHTDGSQGPNALYTKGVWCFRRAKSANATLRHQYQDCKPFQLDVFTVAGYDLRSGSNSDRFLFETKTGFDWELFIEAMQRKYELFFQTALAKGNDNDSVVAAALSCGSFRHPRYPQETFTAVATAYARAAHKYEKCFKKIAVVVLGSPELTAIFHAKVAAVKHNKAPLLYQDGMIESVYNKLVDLTDDYLTRTCFSAKGGDTIFQEKKTLFEKFQSILKNPDNSLDSGAIYLSTAKKLRAVHLFKKALDETDKTMLNTHRTADWVRYVAMAASIITVLPFLIRSGHSYLRYGTVQFWKPDSIKVFDRMESETKKLALK